MTSNCRANWNNFSSRLSARVYCSSKIYISSSWNHSCVFFFPFLTFFPLCRACRCGHPHFTPFSRCFITPAAPGCCDCLCVAMETETHFWSRWVFRRFLSWQLFLFRPSQGPVGCHWRMWAMTTSGVVVMNLPPTSSSFPPVSFEWECVSVLPDTHFADISPLVLRYWAVSLCPTHWSREHLWESS